MKEFSPTSVIVPCYNSAKTIGRALNSILNQTMSVKEVIIIDDNSKDNTLVTVLEYKELFKINNINFKMITNENNKGAGYSRTIGIKEANNKYIAFLDSDDIWHPQRIEIQTNIMEQNMDIFIIGGYQKVLNYDDPNEVSSYLNSEISDVKFKYINKKKALFKSPTQTSVVFARNDTFLIFENGKRYSEDFLLWLNILFKGHKMLQVDNYLAASFKANFGESGLSSNLLLMEKNEIDSILRIRKKYKKGIRDELIFMGAINFSLLKFLRRIIIVISKKK